MEGAGPPRPRAWRPHTGCPREGLPVTRQALAEGPRALGAGFVLGRRRDRHGELLPQVRTCARLCMRVHACVCAHTRSQSFGEPEAERAGKGRQDRGTTMTNRRLPGRGRPSLCRPCGPCASPDEGEGASPPPLHARGAREPTLPPENRRPCGTERRAGVKCKGPRRRGSRFGSSSPAPLRAARPRRCPRLRARVAPAVQVRSLSRWRAHFDSTRTNPHAYTQIVFDGGAENMQWRKPRRKGRWGGRRAARRAMKPDHRHRTPPLTRDGLGTRGPEATAHAGGAQAPNSQCQTRAAVGAT